MVLRERRARRRSETDDATTVDGGRPSPPARESAERHARCLLELNHVGLGGCGGGARTHVNTFHTSGSQKGV